MENYFDDKSAVSTSMINRLEENPYLFDAWMRGNYKYPTTQPMIIGTDIHHQTFQRLSGNNYGEDLDLAIVADVNRRTKAGKKTIAEYNEKYGEGNYILESEHELCKNIVDAAAKTDAFKGYFNPLLDKYTPFFEDVFIADITIPAGNNGVYPIKIKGKLDITWYNSDGEVVKVTDLKTTSGVFKFAKSVNIYKYDRQAYQYAMLTGLKLEDDVFDFFAIQKEPVFCRSFKTFNPRFIDRAERRWVDGMSRFVNYERNGVEFFYNELL